MEAVTLKLDVEKARAFCTNCRLMHAFEAMSKAGVPVVYVVLRRVATLDKQVYTLARVMSSIEAPLSTVFVLLAVAAARLERLYERRGADDAISFSVFDYEGVRYRLLAYTDEERVELLIYG